MSKTTPTPDDIGDSILDGVREAVETLGADEATDRGVSMLSDAYSALAERFMSLQPNDKVTFDEDLRDKLGELGTVVAVLIATRAERHGVDLSSEARAARRN